MTARVVNLRQFRKRKARDADRADADANAVEHGRSKAERNLTRALKHQQDQRHEGQKLDDDGD